MPPCAAEVKWLGESVGFWIQTLVLAVSAIGGIWIILSRGKQEGRRATVDLVVEQKRDQQLTEAREWITKVRDKGETNLAKYLVNEESEEYKNILYLLNTYEFISVGIKTGAFSEKTYKRLRYTTLMGDWECFHGFVTEFRKGKSRNTLFQDFEWLYNRWKKNPLKKIEQ